MDSAGLYVSLCGRMVDVVKQAEHDPPHTRDRPKSMRECVFMLKIVPKPFVTH